MKYGNIELTGSLDISGSFTVPSGITLPDETSTPDGSLFFDTANSVLCGLVSGSWATMPPVAGSNPFPVSISYLLVAGGGGGGSSGAGSGAGGAGGLLSSSISPPNSASGSTFTVTVGAAGAGGTGTGYGNHGANGQNSSISYNSTTTTATGGGGGSGGNQVGSSGGSGGGGNGGYATAGGSGTTGQGDDGGDGVYYSGGSGQDAYAGGGGGGASQVGSDGFANASSEIGGTGGTGLASNITGTSTHYAGGGGGGAGYRRTTTAGVAGTGGGGTGASSQTSDATAGAANTGGGGGGGGGYTSNPNGGSSRNGKSGGAGVAIFAYGSGSLNCAGGIVGDAGNGRKYNQFNSSGTFKVGSTSNFEIVTDSLYLNLDAGDFASRGTSTWTDLSGNSRNGTVTGATLGTNWYYDFDGSNDRMDFSAADIGGTNFTVEVWVNPDSSQVAYANIFDYDHTGSKGFTIQQANNTTNTYYFYTGGNYNNFTNIPAGTWAHLLVSISGTSVVQYLNGVQDGTFTASSNSDTTGERITLASWRAGGSHSRYWNGQYGQCRVYNKALTASEVLQNYNATKTNFI